MIWVKVKKQHSSSNIIFLPHSVAKKLPKKVKLQFGLQNLNVVINSVEVNPTDENSYNNPIELKCSEGIIEKLLIRENLAYQLIYKKGILHVGPVIGYLLGEQSYTYHDRNMQGITRGMGILPEIGGLFIAFKDISIDWDNMVINGLYYEAEENKWKYGVLPMPSVVFRRAFYTNEEVVDKLKLLTGNKVFNSTRFDKWEVHKILEKNLNFKKYLPETYDMVNVKFFHNLIKKSGKIILKPAGLSRGRGICFIQRIGDSFAIYDYRNSDDANFYILKKKEIDLFLKKNFLNRNYIIQNQLTLATINGSPFDIRIVMGKNPDKCWKCRGIECRLAGSKNKITNISRGGQALSINNAIKLAFGKNVNGNKIKEKLISVATEFCEFMDKTGEHFAEFGLDFAIDPQQHFWFIEANVRPVFRGFKTMDYKNYLHIRHMPLIYAATLAGFGREEKNSESTI